MRVIKDSKEDQGLGYGFFYLIPECGIDIEFIDILIKIFNGRWVAGDSENPVRELATITVKFNG